MFILNYDGWKVVKLIIEYDCLMLIASENCIVLSSGVWIYFHYFNCEYAIKQVWPNHANSMNEL
jgi:hypothetical protein